MSPMTTLAEGSPPELTVKLKGLHSTTVHLQASCIFAEQLASTMAADCASSHVLFALKLTTEHALWFEWSLLAKAFDC